MNPSAVPRGPFWIMGLMGQVSILITQSLVVYLCFSCVAGTKSQPDALIEPKKPKLNTAVQECQAAEMSKRNISTFPNRTFPELSDKKLLEKAVGCVGCGLGSNKQISEQQKSVWDGNPGRI